MVADEEYTGQAAVEGHAERLCERHRRAWSCMCRALPHWSLEEALDWLKTTYELCGACHGKPFTHPLLGRDLPL